MNNRSQYELMVILDPDMEEGKSLDAVRSLVIDRDMEIKEEDLWGLRTLAYPINKKTQGRYALFYVSTNDRSKLVDLKKELNIHSAVLRYTLIKSRG
ncbi:30S ribosomal protein S6 [candidate division WWE3 bacterium]|uniref:Small ribosomal subunit protein bS6 n=1 Tax=candidate division WWE3 bacterium TaxID=2053526 RepID=A0A955LK74_UNCKA|nr:30S ribosomal protein S6 [candidate division WWE3 bacterium]